MKWLESFKIAIIEEDITSIDSHLKEIPEFKKIEHMREAYALIEEAKSRFEKEQTLMKDKMNKMQHAKKFFMTEEKNKLDEVS
jgi:hypothetical protein